MLRIEYPFKKKILACGAETKANFCLTKKNCGFVINDLGSLNEGAALANYQREIERLREELKIKPKVITHDLDPEYNSTKYAQTLAAKISGLELLPTQHHQAHIASCMGESEIDTAVIGVVFDAGALGEDGQVWGGEFFIGSPKGFKRMAHLKYTPIQEGELVDGLHSSSVAKLFDRVAGLMGLRDRVEYEGQGAFDLERIVNRSSHVASKIYDFVLKQEEGLLLIHHQPILENIVADISKNISKSIISAAFHNTIIEIVQQVCRKIKQKEKIKDVILTGSIFQNKVLFNRLNDLLAKDGFAMIIHRRFSCNDNSISFGQAVLANAKE